MASGTASVKAVLSGDTVVLVGKALGSGPPQEITITLASLQAPRISRGPQQSNEDASAWESREFLRKLCIGKTVSFKIVYCVASINRTFGDIFLPNTSEDPDAQPVCLSELVVAAGWSPVRGTEGPSSGTDKLSSRHDTLLVLEADAKAAGRGMHGAKGPIRSICWAPTSTEVEEIFNKHKGIPLTVVVEYVRDGASLRVLLLESMTYLSFSLAGIICPRINASKQQPQATAAFEADTPAAASSTGKPEPFALQARHFTELRLLNREVQIVMQTLDRTGNVLGSVLHPKGNIAVEMVKNGLAKVADRSLAALDKETVFALRVAEKEAQAAQRFIWTGYQPAAPSACMRYFEGTVIEIVSGDTVVVVEGQNDKEIKITFSSIKVPRLGNVKGEGLEPWAIESRELLKTRLIGKKVGVSVEYERIQSSPAQPSNVTKRIFATVKALTGKETQGQGKNVALMLVTEGVATCVKHRDGEERSSEYDSYLMAEADAASKGKCIHGTQPAPSSLSSDKLIDLTTGAESKKAKAFISLMLQRGSTPSSSGVTTKGTVDFVYSGSRVKVLLPSENCVLQLTLNQVRCPLPSRGASASAGAARVGEPFAEEAKAFTRKNLMHRQVEVRIDDVDKNGVALGRIYLITDTTAKKGAKAAYALSLVAAGLARVDVRHASEKPSSEITEMQEAQAIALEEGRAMWSVPEIVAEEELRQSGGARGGKDGQNDEGYGDADGEDLDLDVSALAVTGSGPRTKGSSLRGDEERVTVRVCEISDGVNFFVHVISESRSKMLKSVEQQMATYASTRASAAEGDAAAPASTPEAKKGQLVLALFDDRTGSGPAWFRAKVEEVEVGGKKARVQFIDYGNRAVVSMSEIASVDPPSSSSASKSTSAYFAQPPLALECMLAFLSPPSAAEDRNGDDLIRAAGLSLGDLTWDRDLSMQILGRDYASNKLLVALYDDVAKVERGDDDEATEGEEKEVEAPENVFDGEGEESRKRRAALSLSQRVLSVNELMLMDGLARISRSSTRMVPKVSVGGRGAAGKGDRALSTLAASLLAHLEDAQKHARRAHTNLFRYGDPADSDEERENDREKEREKKDRDSKAK